MFLQFCDNYNKHSDLSLRWEFRKTIKTQTEKLNIVVYILWYAKRETIACA